MATADQVLNAALSLSLDERAEVAHKLLLSLEPADFDADADQAWAEEIKRRLHAIRDGSTTLRAWDDALSDIRQSIHSRDKA